MKRRVEEWEWGEIEKKGHEEMGNIVLRTSDFCPNVKQGLNKYEFPVRVKQH